MTDRSQSSSRRGLRFFPGALIFTQSPAARQASGLTYTVLGAALMRVICVRWPCAGLLQRPPISHRARSRAFDRREDPASPGLARAGDLGRRKLHATVAPPETAERRRLVPRRALPGANSAPRGKSRRGRARRAFRTGPKPPGLPPAEDRFRRACKMRLHGALAKSRAVDPASGFKACAL